MTQSLSAPHHGVMQPRPGRHVRLVAAGVLGAVGIAASSVPGLGDDQLAWLPVVLVVPLVTWCVLPVHRETWRGVAGGRWTPDVLATISIAAAFAWAVDAAVAGGDAWHLVPVTLATVVMVVAQQAGTLAGVDHPYGGAPRWLTPLVLVVAAAAWVAWWIPEGPGPAGSAAVASLLVAGPGALRLAAPAALLVGARRAVAIGMTPGNADTMDIARRIDTIVLDKDGTVTTGDLSVASVDADDPEHLRNMRWFAGALEHGSEHPIGRAIAKLSGPGRVTDLVHRPGLGVSGSVDRHPVRAGRPSWIGVDATEGLGIEIAVEVDGRALGSIRVADTLRPHAPADVDRLRGLGLEPVLVSDRPETDTTHLAGQAGIATSHAGLDVDQRCSLIQRLQADGRVVAMVGDHARNAAAMQAADLAISTAGESSGPGITLADIDVQKVAGAIVLARQTSDAALAGRRGAIGGMLVPLPFAAAGLIDPVYASVIALVCLVGVGVRSWRIPRLDRPAG